MKVCQCYPWFIHDYLATTLLLWDFQLLLYVLILSNLPALSTFCAYSSWLFPKLLTLEAVMGWKKLSILWLFWWLSDMKLREDSICCSVKTLFFIIRWFLVSHPHLHGNLTLSKNLKSYILRQNHLYFEYFQLCVLKNYHEQNNRRKNFHKERDLKRFK